MKIKIIANPRKPWAKELAGEVAAFLKPAHTMVREGADATICIGGDGTILFANHKGRLEGAVLGIGSEKSYICQLRNDSWQKHISAALESRKASVMSLEAKIGGETYSALNDFVVHATHYRVAELEVAYDGSRASFEGDGVIVSTPLGSAGYAYSAGAERLGPTERKIIVAPICPYKRAFSPKILTEGGSAEVRVGSDCAFILDGIFVRKLEAGETVCMAKGKDIEFFEGVGNDDHKG